MAQSVKPTTKGKTQNPQCNYCPISAITLCLLAKKYKLAYTLLLHICRGITFNKDHLIQLCNIVQLIESPTLLPLRLELLDPHNNYYLFKTLQCILMMLPIGKAFTALKTRLELMKVSFKIYGRKPLPEIQQEEEDEIVEYLEMMKNSIESHK